MLPIRISIDIYDRHIRAIFPNLPSVRNLLLTIRTTMLSIFTSPPSPPSAPKAPIRTLPVDLNTLRAGGS